MQWAAEGVDWLGRTARLQAQFHGMPTALLWHFVQRRSMCLHVSLVSMYDNCSCSIL